MDIVFFWLSKLVWLFISPDSLLLILFVIGLFFLWRDNFQRAKKIMTLLAFLLLLIGFLPVGEWLTYSLEKQYPANPTLDKVDGIIMLGGAENTVLSDYWKQAVLGGSSERDFAFMQLVKKYPNAKAVYTGGTGSLVNQTYKGADVAKQLFDQQGLDTTKILFERESKNTWENVKFSKERITPHKKENWVLITSASHMPRSVGIFCKANWDVIPYPVDYRSRGVFRLNWNLRGNLSRLKTGLKEWIGIVAYRLTDKMC